MIKITRVPAEEDTTTQLRVEGRITVKTARQLETACRARLRKGDPLLLELTGVNFIDADGARLVHGLVREGGVIVASSPLVDELLRSSAPDRTGRSGCGSPADDEAQLLERLRANDADAFEDLVRLYGGRLLAVARRMLRSEDDARDAVQEAFVSAHKGLGTFEGTAKLSTWLHRIVVNAALMRLRSRSRHPEESIDELLPHFDESGAWTTEVGVWESPSELAEQRDTRAAVRRCIDLLPESYRATLLLRDIEELDTDETAAALGITTSAVKTRLHRARQALRTLLERYLALTPGSPRNRGRTVRDGLDDSDREVAADVPAAPKGRTLRLAS